MTREQDESMALDKIKTRHGKTNELSILTHQVLIGYVKNLDVFQVLYNSTARSQTHLEVRVKKHMLGLGLALGLGSRLEVRVGMNVRVRAKG